MYMKLEEFYVKIGSGDLLVPFFSVAVARSHSQGPLASLLVLAFADSASCVDLRPGDPRGYVNFAGFVL